MDESEETPSAKGTGSKGNVGKGKISATKSRDSGRKERDDAKRFKEDPTKGRPAQRGSAAPRSGEEEAYSDEERDHCAEEEDSVIADSRKKAPAKVKKSKIFQSAEDVDAEIANLKPPPRKLSREDFAEEYSLCDESTENPHRYRKNSLPAKLVRKYFGEPVGDSGRGGYSWQQCEHAQMRARIKKLHPIMYQHGPHEVPALLKVHFAEGVAMEFEKGEKEVNWCLFGEETNKRQRNRYDLDVKKLQKFKTTLQTSTKSGEMKGLQWRSIKLEPSTTPVKVKLQGGLGSSKAAPLLSRSKLGETGGESVVSADVGGPELHRGSLNLSKANAAERQVEVESLMSVVHMEGEVLKIQQKEAELTLEKCQWRKRETECLVGTFKGQQEVKGKLIEDMKSLGVDVGRELIKLEMLEEQLASEEKNLIEANFNLQRAETTLATLAQKILCHRLEFDALVAQSWSLKRGRIDCSFCPRPAIYAPMEENPLELTSFSAETSFLGITVCSLCSFPFPHNDIIVSSCRHLYHPFCASVVFSNTNKCMAVGCKAMSHPEWHRSFGWGEPGPELVERALMLGLAEERKKILQDRSDAAKARCPHFGECILICACCYDLHTVFNVENEVVFDVLIEFTILQI